MGIVVDKKFAMSLFIVISFALSMAAYPLLRATRNQSAVTADNPLLTNYSFSRPLEADEKRLVILGTYRVIIENLYNNTDGEFIPVLDTFASENAQNVFVVQALVNDTASLRMIGSGGDIIPLDRNNMTDEYLFNILCEYGVTKPLECSLREM